MQKLTLMMAYLSDKSVVILDEPTSGMDKKSLDTVVGLINDMKKKKIQGTVTLLFIVDADGRVKEPKVQKSDHPSFDAPALNAVKRWRFDPGKVGGQPVQFRMRVPITFAL